MLCALKSLLFAAAGVVLAITPQVALGNLDGYPCGSYYPKAMFYKPWTWRNLKYAKYNYYTGDCKYKVVLKNNNNKDPCVPVFSGIGFEVLSSETKLFNGTVTTNPAAGPIGNVIATKTSAWTFVLSPPTNGNSTTFSKYVCALDPIGLRIAKCTSPDGTYPLIMVEFDVSDDGSCSVVDSSVTGTSIFGAASTVFLQSVDMFMNMTNGTNGNGTNGNGNRTVN